MNLEWSEWQGEQNPVTMAKSGDYLALIQQVTPAPETAWRNRRYEIQHKGECLVIGFCNGTTDAEAIVQFILEHSIG